MTPTRLKPTHEEPLAELRADLQVVQSVQGIGFVIFDPLRQQYFRVNDLTAQLISLWPECQTSQDLIALASARRGRHVTAEQIAELKLFLVMNQLAVPRDARSWAAIAAISRRGRPGWMSWLVHNYLFLKVPLFKPQPLLNWLTPRLSFLYTRAFAIAVAAIGLLGLYLVSRQWSAFTATFSHMATVEGAIAFALALAIVKSLHELGHAVTATRYGCRVPTAGICFMVLVPMLYTDATDAWRLQSRKQRVAIDSAGMVVETVVACIATFLWSFLPEGPMKGLAFAMATTSWVLSLGLNLNPLMRFDGYYILSDAAGIENLQSRAFAIGRWRLRELLFALGHSPPEELPVLTRRWLALYAWAVWIYRFFLFTAIAIVVYGIGFKLLGIVLFLLEIIYFVAGPIWHEMREWNRMRALIINRRRGLWLAGGAVTVIVACLIPWSTKVLVPSVMDARDVAQVYPRRAAYVVEAIAKQGEMLGAGANIARLASPEIEQEIRQTALKIEHITWRLGRRGGNALDLADTMVLEQMRDGLRSRMAGLEQESRELSIVAPTAGVVAELAMHLHPGRWLQRDDLIALIVSHGGCSVRGYISEDDVARLDLTQPAYFVSEDFRQPRIDVSIDQIATAGTAAMEIAELASHYGGAIAARSVTRPREGRTLAPVVGQYLVEGRATGNSDCNVSRVVRGTLHVTGRAESFAARGWRHVLKVVVRESGM